VKPNIRTTNNVESIVGWAHKVLSVACLVLHDFPSECIDAFQSTPCNPRVISHTSATCVILSLSSFTSRLDLVEGLPQNLNQTCHQTSALVLLLCLGQKLDVLGFVHRLNGLAIQLVFSHFKFLFDRLV
jgi:hypothetical protein